MAISEAYKIITSPDVAQAKRSHRELVSQYDYLWAWQEGTVLQPFSRHAAPLRSQYRLYRHTRLVWNKFPHITGFYGAVIYPGSLTRNGLPFPDGTPTAIPFSDDTKPEIITATAQMWWWSNMKSLKSVIPFRTAVAGVQLVTIEDEQERQKVVKKVWWPSLVSDVVLNSAGDVMSYTLEYKDKDERGTEYTYRKEVTKEAFRTFKNDRPFDYRVYLEGDRQVGPEWENPYGFVPACWHKHSPSDGVYAPPAIGAMLGELLEINSLQSMIDDQAKKSISPIPVIFGTGNVTPLFDKAKRAATDDLDPSDADRESVQAWKGPPDGSIDYIKGVLSIAEAKEYLKHLKEGFLQAFPEVSMWESLRQRDVSGIAAEILHGDTRNKVLDVRAQHDRQTEKEAQMALAIGGFRANLPGNRGGWGTNLTRQQAAFLPFDLESYDKGELDFELAPRPLIPEVPMTELEKVELMVAKKKGLGISSEYLLEKDGGEKKSEIKKMGITSAAPAPMVNAAAAIADTAADDNLPTNKEA